MIHRGTTRIEIACDPTVTLVDLYEYLLDVPTAELVFAADARDAGGCTWLSLPLNGDACLSSVRIHSLQVHLELCARAELYCVPELRKVQFRPKPHEFADACSVLHSMLRTLPVRPPPFACLTPYAVDGDQEGSFYVQLCPPSAAQTMYRTCSYARILCMLTEFLATMYIRNIRCAEPVVVQTVSHFERNIPYLSRLLFLCRCLRIESYIRWVLTVKYNVHRACVQKRSVR